MVDAFVESLWQAVQSLWCSPKWVLVRRTTLPRGTAKDAAPPPLLPAGLTDQWAAYDKALGEYRQQKASKAAVMAKERARKDDLVGPLRHYMLEHKLLSKSFTGSINGEPKRMFVKLRVVPPKVGKPANMGWMKSSVQTFLEGGMAGGASAADEVAAWMQGETYRPFLAPLRLRLEEGLQELAQIEVRPATVGLKLFVQALDEGSDTSGAMV